MNVFRDENHGPAPDILNNNAKYFVITQKGVAGGELDGDTQYIDRGNRGSGLNPLGIVPVPRTRKAWNGNA